MIEVAAQCIVALSRILGHVPSFRALHEKKFKIHADMDESKSLDVNGNSKMTCEGEDEDWEDEDDWTDGDEDDGADKTNERLVHVRPNREVLRKIL